jgi:hypothetical protein
VFASPEVGVLPHTHLDLDERDLVAATDHLPVWVDLDLAPASSPSSDEAAELHR